MNIFNFRLNPVFSLSLKNPYQNPTNGSSLIQWLSKFKISRLVIGWSEFCLSHCISWNQNYWINLEFMKKRRSSIGLDINHIILKFLALNYSLNTNVAKMLYFRYNGLLEDETLITTKSSLKKCFCSECSFVIKYKMKSTVVGDYSNIMKTTFWFKF